MIGHARAYLKNLVSLKITLFLMIYTILSLVCFLFDVIAFFVGVSLMSNEISTWSDYEYLDGTGTSIESRYDYVITAEAYGAPIVLILESLFLTLSLWYIIWAVTYMIKLPSSIGSMVVMSLIGFPQKLTKHLADPNAPEPEKVEKPKKEKEEKKDPRKDKKKPEKPQP